MLMTHWPVSGACAIRLVPETMTTLPANDTGRKITKMDSDFGNFEDDDVIADILSW